MRKPIKLICECGQVGTIRKYNQMIFERCDNADARRIKKRRKVNPIGEWPECYRVARTY